MRRLRGLLFALASLAPLWPAVARADQVLWNTLSPQSTIAFSSQGNASFATEAADDFIIDPARFGDGFAVRDVTFQGLFSDPTATIASVDVAFYQEFASNTSPGTAPFTRVNGPADQEFASYNFGAGQFDATSLNSAFTVNQTILPGSATQFGSVGGAVTGDLRQIHVSLPIELILGPTNPPTAANHVNHYWMAVTVNPTVGDYYWVAGARPPIEPAPPLVDRQTWLTTSAFDPNWRRVSDILNNSNGTTTPAFNASFKITGRAVPEPGSIALLGIGLVVTLGIRFRRRSTVA